MAGRSLMGWRGWAVFLAAGFVLLVVLPLMNVWAAPGSALSLPNYLVPLLGKYACYAILALSLDLVWGYAGILSLGHGAFFALGGYCMGMYLMRQIGARGVYGNAELPDFMVFLNWKELPWYWYGFDHFAFAAIMALIVPGLLALVFGFLAFRSRITGVYLSIITQAMTFALLLAFFRNALAMLPGAPRKIAGDADIERPVWPVRGDVDAESRVRFLGYSVTHAKLFVFTVSAVLAGFAGALYVPQVGIINPSEFSPANSIEIAIWVAVGGRGTLVGAILGAVIVNAGKSYLTGAAPDLWLFVLGGLFILVTLALPQGIVGLVRRPPGTKLAVAAAE